MLAVLKNTQVPKNEGSIVLEDFLHPHRIRISGAFFNVLFNLNKVVRSSNFHYIDILTITTVYCIGAAGPIHDTTATRAAGFKRLVSS